MFQMVTYYFPLRDWKLVAQINSWLIIEMEILINIFMREKMMFYYLKM